MTWLSARVEVETPKGVTVLYPSFVRELEGGNAGGPLAELIDCWVPILRDDPVLDYEQGRLHFFEAQRVAFENEHCAFLNNVLHAMADHGRFEAIERGFVFALCQRAIVGTRSGYSDSRRFADLAPDDLRIYADDAWQLVDVCRDISSVELLFDQAEVAIADNPAAPWNRVYLSVLAGLAYNGARH